ncbi:hypothetical protein [Absiella sp. AM29-15]|uniref:hypothetical protein n=1 Tax=Absiella sp. AM29-15 TaxID=2292278 RepID=UPI000E41C160|nr:hypothetical protein [Absiella sp. AM29-15]RGC50155.1 hypothetical protein DW761_12765 [Absiella sp. AM29-15]
MKTHLGKKWYQNNLLCIIMLVIFPPIGLFLLWKYHRTWKTMIRWVATVLSVLWGIFFVVVANGETPESIHISSQDITIEIKDTIFVPIDVQPEGTQNLVKFQSEDESIVSFEEDQKQEVFTGKITALKEGSTTIYAYYHDKVISNKIKVEVVDTQKQKVREKAAADIDKNIVALGTITLEKQEAIKNIRTSYDALDKKGQQLVKHYTELEKAEKTIEKLQNEEKQQIKTVEKDIEDIGTVSLKSKASIQKARKEYDALRKASQKKVSNYTVLVSAEKAYQDLEAKEQQKAEAKQQEAIKKQQEAAAKQQQENEAAAKQQQNSTNDTYHEEQNSPSQGLVYWTPNGGKYHASSSCRTLKKSKTIIQGTVEEAKAAGKDALCKVCGH